MSAVRALKPTSYGQSVDRLYPFVYGVTVPPPDTEPDPFSFTDQTGVPRSSVRTSAPVTITGIDAPATANATNGLIDVNEDGDFQASREVINGDDIRAQHTSSASYSAATNTVVDINGVSDTFTSTTLAEPAPTLLNQIPNLSAVFNSSTHQFDLSVYFDGATSYAISPAVETGWSFNTGTGVLTIDTDDEDTFGPYTVTATNAQGDTPSNAFTVRVSAWDRAGYVGGTAVSAEGVMGTTFLDDSTPVPAASFFVNGFAHDDTGRRYVALWPGTGVVYFHAQQGVARRSDGAMIINPSGTIATHLAGWALTARGEVVAVVDTPDLIHSGYGLLSDGKLCVSEVS